MILSTPTDYLSYRLGLEKAIRLLCETGYDALDFTMFCLANEKDPLHTEGNKYVEKIKKIVDGYGVYFNQAHAPFPSFKEGDEEFNKRMFKAIVRSMEICCILEIGIVVVHPIDWSNAQEVMQKNVEFFNSLIPYCEKYNVKIALENSHLYQTAEQLSELVDSLDDKFFTVCLDTGHCHLFGQDTASMIRKLGNDRLKALHVHDNDAVIDRHTAPYFGTMDWTSITNALAEINYSGDFTLEADSFYHKLPNELLPASAKYLHDIGRLLVEMVEKAKKSNS